MFYTPYYQSKFAITRRSSHILSKHENKTSFGEIRPKKRVFSLFLCAAGLPSSSIMHVPISELHAQWY